METFLKLHFGTDTDKTSVLTITDAKEPADPNITKTFMNAVVKDGMVQTSQGTLDKIIKARFVKVDTMEYDVN